MLSSAAGSMASSAVTGALTGHFSLENSRETLNWQVFPPLTGAVASAAGKDINTAVTAGQNETLNNYLTRSQKTQMFAELDVCQGQVFCKAQVFGKYGVISGQQDIAFATGTGIGIIGQLAETGIETIEGIEQVIDDPVGTARALKVFLSNLDADTIKRLGIETVDRYKQRLSWFEENYQKGGAEGA